MIHYAYIGAGATTTAMLWHHVRLLVQQIALGRLNPSERPVRISIFEKSGQFGAGMPYGDGSLDCHLVNMQSSTLSIDPEDSEDFHKWLALNEATLRERHPGLDLSRGGYPPRTVLGRYLTERFREAEELAARHGLRVERVPREVIDLTLTGRGAELRLETGSTLHVDRVLLATGHWPSSHLRHCEALGARLEARGVGGCFLPWPAQALRAKVPGGATVAGLGTSLTAVDVALTLLDDGGRYVRDARSGELVFIPDEGCRTVLLHSRTGLIPRVRSTREPPASKNPFLTKKALPELTLGERIPPSYDEVMRLFRRRLEHAFEAGAGETLDWARLFAPLADADDVTQRTLEVLAEDLRNARDPSERWNRMHHDLRDTYGVFAQLYRRFTAEDKRRFEREFFRAFNMHAGSMPLENAEKIHAFLHSGRLRILSGLREIVPNEREEGFELHCVLPSNREERTHARYLVNAVGQDKQIDDSPAALFQNGLRKGLLSPHPAGGIRVDYEGSNVIDREGNPSPWIFAIGPMTLGERLGYSAIVASAKFARLLAIDLVSQLVVNPRGAP